MYAWYNVVNMKIFVLQFRIMSPKHVSDILLFSSCLGKLMWFDWLHLIFTLILQLMWKSMQIVEKKNRWWNSDYNSLSVDFRCSDKSEKCSATLLFLFPGQTINNCEVDLSDTVSAGDLLFVPTETSKPVYGNRFIAYVPHNKTSFETTIMEDLVVA